MKIALLGGTGETGVEVILGQNTNEQWIYNSFNGNLNFNFKLQSITNEYENFNGNLKFNLVLPGGETGLAAGSPGYPWGGNLHLLWLGQFVVANLTFPCLLVFIVWHFYLFCQLFAVFGHFSSLMGVDTDLLDVRFSRREIRKGWNHRGTSKSQTQTSFLCRWSNGWF